MSPILVAVDVVDVVVVTVVVVEVVHKHASPVVCACTDGRRRKRRDAEVSPQVHQEGPLDVTATGRRMAKERGVGREEGREGDGVIWGICARQYTRT